MTTTHERTPRGVGARVTRKEDRRHLAGHGSFIADMVLPGMLDVAFVHSQDANGRIRSISVPEGTKGTTVWTASDLEGLARPIVADSGRTGFRHSAHPLLATEYVRFVGEPVVACLAEDRYAAEDLIEQVELDIEPLPAVVDAVTQADGEARVHQTWPDNRFLVTQGDFGDVDAAARGAAVSVTRQYRLARQGVVPMEPRGWVATYDDRLDQVHLYGSTQIPHLVRTAVANSLGLEERRIRVIAPDVGGGFGLKANLDTESILLAAMAYKLRRPVRWIEDSWEHLSAAPQARGHFYTITAYADADGIVTGLDADIVVDAGAYSIWPWTSVMEAGQSSSVLPGPYRIRDYRFRATTVATNKPPIGPYRGVARPGATFAMERTLDELAVKLEMDPVELRRRNMIQPHEMPYTTVTGLTYDSGDYPGALDLAERTIRELSDRKPGKNITGGRYVAVGTGYACYTEQTAHGTKEWATRGLPISFGFETARATMDPSGGITIAVGIQSHGQGLETSLAQIASDILGVDPSEISVRHGDTDLSPFGLGTFSSRALVMAGGATHRASTALADRVREVAAELMDCKPSEVSLSEGKATGPQSSVSFNDVAQAAYYHLNRIGDDKRPGLDVLETYQPDADTGAYSYATHAARVAVDLESGHVDVVDFVVIHDCGRVVNPMIVEGQVYGGVAQGIGTAMFEEFKFDDVGTPTVTSHMDYLLPGATEVPPITLHEMETLSPITEMGVKGMGEGGAIAPPAAVANAVTNALRPWGGAEINATPVSPRRVWEAMNLGATE